LRSEFAIAGLEMLAALEASGLSRSAFAARHQVQAQRIALWQQKFKSLGETPHLSGAIASAW